MMMRKSPVAQFQRCLLLIPLLTVSLSLQARAGSPDGTGVNAQPAAENQPPSSQPPPMDNSRLQDIQPQESGEDMELPEVSPIKRFWLMRMLSKIPFGALRYYFLAQNAHNCDFFYGLVQDNPLIGRASLKFAFPNGCDCHGVAQVTHFPRGGPAAGQSGYIKATCSDGRTIRGRFTTTSLTTGNGTGSDSLGNEYQFTFGHTAEQSVQSVNVLRKELHCPECTPEDIELGVQARIIKRQSNSRSRSEPAR